VPIPKPTPSQVVATLFEVMPSQFQRDLTDLDEAFDMVVASDDEERKHYEQDEEPVVEENRLKVRMSYHISDPLLNQTHIQRKSVEKAQQSKRVKA
jgi:hypothetical protein